MSSENDALLEQLLQIKDSLPENDRRRLLDLLEKREHLSKVESARTSFLDFIKLVWPEFLIGDHHRRIADLFEKVANGEITRLIINLPPRHSKSELTSYLLPAWFLGKFPKKKIIQASHTAELAVSFGRKVRNLVNEDVYKEIFPDTQLRADSKAAGRWNTSAGGDYNALGVGGAAAGKGADLFVVDDPSSEQEAIIAESNPEVYDKQYEWFVTGPLQRLQPNGSVIILQTRWSKRDLTGQVLKAAAQNGGQKWEVVEFPAILPSGKPLWPEFWSIEELEAKRAQMPRHYWEAQYQQNPVSEGAAIVKREWWRIWQNDTPPECEFTIMSWDTAFEKHNRADYSACTLWGVFYQTDLDSGLREANIILLNAFRDRLEFPALKKRAIEQYKNWMPDSTIVEKKASGAPLIYEMRAMGIPVQEYTPSKGQDKIARLNSVADLFASGRVWAPQTRWAEAVMDEIAEFPAGEHDDYCVVGDTEIITRRGVKPISEIVVGDEVLSHKGFRKVVWSGQTGVAPVKTVAVTGGRRVSATAGHPIYTQRGFVRMDCITIADRVECVDTVMFTRRYTWLGKRTRMLFQNLLSFLVGLTTVTQSLIGKHIGGITCGQVGDICYTGMCTNTIRDQYRKGMTYTIKMVTLATMTQAILRPFQGRSTCDCTPKNGMLKVVTQRLKNTLLGYAPLHLSGMALKKVSCGITSTMKTQKRPWLKVSVNGLKIWRQTHISSLVGSVGKFLKQSPPKPSIVHQSVFTGHIEGVSGWSDPVPVYNLEVEDAHTYYANGVLVHNCDSATLALMRFRAGGFIRTALDEDYDDYIPNPALLDSRPYY